MVRHIERRLPFTNPVNGHEFTCTDCRRRERGRVPCDRGGLDACFYWATHEASPGEVDDYGCQQAVALYQQVQAQGWAQATALRTWRLSRPEAEALGWRVAWLQANLPGMLGAPSGP